MKFPNAHNGVKKVYTAEILSLIASITFVVAAVFAVVIALNVKNSDAETAIEKIAGVYAGLAVFSIIGSILALVAFVLNLAGINSAKKDDGAFKTALIFALAGVVTALISTFFSKNETVSSLTVIISNLLEMLVAYYVVQGIINLAGKLKKSDMIEQGIKVHLYLTIAYCVPIVVGFVSVILLKKANLAANILSLISAVLTLFVYFIYLRYLKKAIRMLEA